MKLKIVLLLIVFGFTTIILNGQNDLNGYKYILVPRKFDFQKVENKHQLNSLTKFLFNKEGFVALFDDEKPPQDLYDNPCLALRAKINNKSNMFTTKVNIGLLNCRNTEIFISSDGKSKVKDFKKAFHQATRKAFESIKSLEYSYDSGASIHSKVTLEKDDPIIEEVIEKPVANIPTEEPKPTEVIEEIVEKKEVMEKKEMIVEEKPIEIKEDVVKAEDKSTDSSDVLYAQSKPFGFQLVDSTPKVVYILQRSSMKEVFILKLKNGILHKVDEKWIAEYYENGTLIKKEVQIKF